MKRVAIASAAVLLPFCGSGITYNCQRECERLQECASKGQTYDMVQCKADCERVMNNYQQKYLEGKAICIEKSCELQDSCMKQDVYPTCTLPGNFGSAVQVLCDLIDQCPDIQPSESCTSNAPPEGDPDEFTCLTTDAVDLLAACFKTLTCDSGVDVFRCLGDVMGGKTVTVQLGPSAGQ